MTQRIIQTTNRSGLNIIHVICGVLAMAWLLPPAITHADDADDASAVLLPANMENDVITQHLRVGEFDEAREVAESQFGRGDGQLALRLYQHGMAHLGLAGETGDDDHYKTAGISFMRALTYFPRSRFAGYAELELGYVHARIGRDDIARRLLTRVRPAIDPEQDPDYYERLMTLLGELP